MPVFKAGDRVAFSRQFLLSISADKTWAKKLPVDPMQLRGTVREVRRSLCVVEWDGYRLPEELSRDGLGRVFSDNLIRESQL